jgi:hypothetical protein
MSTDSVIAEVRKAREELAKRFNYDLRAMSQDARDRQATGGRKIMSLPPKPVATSQEVYMNQGRLPLPVAVSFNVCFAIRTDPRTGLLQLDSLFYHWPITDFPAAVRLSVYALLTGGHGSYQLCLTLRNADDNVVWKWQPPALLEDVNPIFPRVVKFLDLVVNVPRLGRYSLALLADGQEFAQQGLWFGPAEAFI